MLYQKGTQRIEVIVRKDGGGTPGLKDSDAEDISADATSSGSGGDGLSNKERRRRRFIKTNTTHFLSAAHQVVDLKINYELGGIGHENGDQNYQDACQRYMEKVQDTSNFATSVAMGAAYGSWGGPAGAAFGAAPGALMGLCVLTFFYFKYRARWQLASENVGLLNSKKESVGKIAKRLLLLALPVSCANIVVPITSSIDMLLVPNRLIASGFAIDEYVEVCQKLDACEQVGWLEVNVSCPNVHGGGMSFGTSPEAAAEVVRAVKAVTTKPVIIKLSPNVTDIVSIAKACEEAGADGLSLINTLLGMRIDLRTKKPVIANKMGGFSGPAILPVALRMVYQVTNAVSIPVVGMGGVSCAEDVIEMMLAGATAVEIGAANLVDPYVCEKIIRDLPAAMDRYGITNLKDIIGGVQ